MEIIKVEGLDIDIVQKVVGIVMRNPHAVERTATGIKWNGNVELVGESGNIGNRAVRIAIANNSEMSFVELNTAAQATLSKDYVDLTVVESQTVQGNVLATKMIGAINAADTGISITDVTELVTAIVTALQ